MGLTTGEPLPQQPEAESSPFKLWARVTTWEGVVYTIYWRRIVATIALGGVACWLSGATAIWVLLRFQREWTEVSFVDVAFYPVRSNQFRQAQAVHYMDMARQHIEKKNYRTAYPYFTSALRHAPANLEVRKQAAIYMVRYGLLPWALDVLAEGLKYNPNPGLDYLKLLFGWLLESHNDDRVVNLAAQYLPKKPDADLNHQFVALQLATAKAEHGQYDAVDKLIADWGLVAIGIAA
jgi:tetratricopeptide (TPR) repeat protein